MKRLNEPWFGKKAVGWGPAPKTWQGWLITILCIGIVILAILLLRLSIYTVIIAILAIAALLVIASLTGEKPGTKES
jgi:CDP-diglyceride synthetase